MDQFIQRENVSHYRELLKTTKDEAERQKILKLLAEEQRKQKDAGDKIEDWLIALAVEKCIFVEDSLSFANLNLSASIHTTTFPNFNSRSVAPAAVVAQRMAAAMMRPEPEAQRYFKY